MNRGGRLSIVSRRIVKSLWGLEDMWVIIVLFSVSLLLLFFLKFSLDLGSVGLCIFEFLEGFRERKFLLNRDNEGFVSLTHLALISNGRFSS
jgi:hypothetical protein